MAGIAIGEAAPELVLHGPDEKPVRLSEVGAGRAVAAIFLRHFG